MTVIYWRIIVLSITLFFSTPSFANTGDMTNCHVGAYRLRDGSVVDIAPAGEDFLRWRRFDGQTGQLRKAEAEVWQSYYGWTDRKEAIRVSFSKCGGGKINFAGRLGQRIAFDTLPSQFAGGDGVQLQGRLVLPKGNKKVPIVVLVHGAEHSSALTDYFFQRLLPAEGIGVFVYDKRGTGISGGTYSQKFDLLADDAVAAMREARRLAGKRAGRIGYQGGSQGGWVAPIAANKAPVDFVIVSFGLAVSVAEEDQQQVELELSDKGYSREIIAQALEVARAAERVFASNFTDGFEEFDAVRAKYKTASWYKDLHGNFTFALLPYTEAELREMAPKYNWETPFHYDPIPTLRSNQTRQLWVLGGKDYEAPSRVTSARIKSLIGQQLPFTLAVYPQAEHGMTLFETTPKGDRLSTRYPPGYFAMMRDFIKKGSIKDAYGDAEITMAQR